MIKFYKRLLFLCIMLSLNSAAFADKTITISGFAFIPANISLTQGEKLTFLFLDAAPHRVASDPGAPSGFDSNNQSNGSMYDITLTTTGTYNYKCFIHPSMTGSFTIAGLPSSIITGSISPLMLCGGESVSVPFTVTGMLPTDGTFVAQLSDENGSFANAFNMPSQIISTGMINATLPSNFNDGNTYRIRVIYDRPTDVIGSDNGQDLQIKHVPTVSITSNASGAVCIGTVLTLTSNVANSSGNIDYRWFANSTVAGGNQSILVISNPGDGDAIFATVTAQAVCSNTLRTITSNILTLQVSSQIVPTLSISGVSNFNSICPQSILTVTATNTGGGASPGLVWSVSGLLTISGTNNTTAFIKGTEGSVSATMTSSLNCVSVSTVVSNQITITPNTQARPQVSISLSASNLVLNLSGSGTTSGPYQWFFNDAPISGAESSLFIPTVSGIYKASYVLICPATSPGFNFDQPSLGITLASENDAWSIYPNPAHQKLYVIRKESTESGLRYVVYNKQGIQMMEKTPTVGVCKSGKGTACTCPGTLELDISALPPGHYLLLCYRSGKEPLRKNFIKE